MFIRFRAANLTLRPEKCDFFRSEVTFLGHTINDVGIRPSPDNLQKVIDWPRPQTVKQVRGFIGLCSYYRRMIKDFATIARPLQELTKLNAQFVWTEACEQAFTTLRNKLVSDPIVRYPNYDLPYILACDASSHAIGAVLSQVEDGVE